MERIKDNKPNKTITIGNIECPAIEIDGKEIPIIIPDKISDKKEEQ